jgi:hypothetical protein
LVRPKNLFLRPDLPQKPPPGAAAVKDLPRASAAQSVIDGRKTGGRIKYAEGLMTKQI